MACCGKGKSGGNDASPEMKEIKVPKFDELFTEGGEILKLVDDLKSGLSDSKAACMTISGAYTLKTGGLADALQCWLWSVGAEVGADKLATMKPAINVESEPHFNMELDPNMSAENKEFFESFKCWCDTVCNAPGQITTLTEKLKGVQEKAQELAGTAKDECTAAGLGAMDAVKAVAAIGTNSKNLATGMTKLTSLGPLGQEAATDMKDLATKIAGMLTDAPKNADEGKGKGAKTAAEFCAKQHPGEKLADAQAKKDTNYTVYTKNKETGKKLPSGAAAAPAAAPASAAEAAPASEEAPAAAADVPAADAEAPVDTADVQASIKDV